MDLPAGETPAQDTERCPSLRVNSINAARLALLTILSDEGPACGDRRDGWAGIRRLSCVRWPSATGTRGV